MKKSELKEIIKECYEEVLNEEFRPSYYKFKDAVNFARQNQFDHSRKIILKQLKFNAKSYIVINRKDPEWEKGLSLFDFANLKNEHEAIQKLS